MTTKRLRSLLEEKIGPMTFGTFLVAAREKLGLTQIEMAKKLKMAPSTLCDIEKGRQIVTTVLAVKIAKMAGLSEKLAIKTCLQDQINKTKLPYEVELKAA